MIHTRPSVAEHPHCYRNKLERTLRSRIQKSIVPSSIASSIFYLNDVITNHGMGNCSIGGTTSAFI